MRYERIAANTSAFESVPFYDDVVVNDRSIRELWQQALEVELGHIEGRINTQDGRASIIVRYKSAVFQIF